MKIRLKHDIPGSEKHGLVAGRVVETLPIHDDDWRSYGTVWVLGDHGKDVRLFPYEYERVEEVRA